MNPALRAALTAQQRTGSGSPSGGGGDGGGLPTGRFGAGGMVGVSGGRAPRSSDLLEQLRQRAQQAARAGDEDGGQVGYCCGCDVPSL